MQVRTTAGTALVSAGADDSPCSFPGASQYGRTLVTGFGTLYGMPVGVVANNGACAGLLATWLACSRLPATWIACYRACLPPGLPCLWAGHWRNRASSPQAHPLDAAVCCCACCACCASDICPATAPPWRTGVLFSAAQLRTARFVHLLVCHPSHQCLARFRCFVQASCSQKPR